MAEIIEDLVEVGEDIEDGEEVVEGQNGSERWTGRRSKDCWRKESPPYRLHNLDQREITIAHNHLVRNPSCSWSFSKKSHSFDGK